MSNFEATAHLLERTEQMCARLMNNLNAIPDDRENHCPGGCARSGVNIVAECATINTMVAHYLNGEVVERPKPEERAALLAAYDTKAKSRAFLAESGEILLEAIRKFDPERWGETASLFPNRTMTYFAAAELPAFHMSYHDGQLAYIQTLYGDSEVHW